MQLQLSSYEVWDFEFRQRNCREVSTCISLHFRPSHDDNPCLAVSQAKKLPLRLKMDSVNAIVLALVELRPLASKRRSPEIKTKYY